MRKSKERKWGEQQSELALGDFVEHSLWVRVDLEKESDLSDHRTQPCTRRLGVPL
jgi:hypothetical protein